MKQNRKSFAGRSWGTLACTVQCMLRLNGIRNVRSGISIVKYNHSIMSTNPIYYFARMVPGYRFRVLEELDRRLDGRLVVCSGQPPGSSSLNYLVSDDRRSYKHVALRNWWIAADKVHAQSFGGVFEEYGRPDVVLAEESPRSVTLPFLLRQARRLGAGRVLWGHFSSLKRSFDPSKHLFDRYRLAMARSVEACACYTQGVADHLRPYMDDEKLFVARNTIDLEPMFMQYDTLAAEGKGAVRARLSVAQNASVLAYLGRLIPEKGGQMLVESFRSLSEKTRAELIVIGEGPERSKMESYVAEHNVGGVRFLGALSDEEAAPYLFASDVMVMPGYLGLVINHAFAFGLPVVSMRKPAGIAAHSPEVEYVESGRTGMLCEGDAPEDLVAGIRQVLSELPRYSENAHAFAREHLHIDRMVDGLYAAIQHASST